MGAIPQKGTLGDTPLPRLRLELYRAGFHGCLRLTRERAEKKVVQLKENMGFLVPEA